MLMNDDMLRSDLSSSIGRLHMLVSVFKQIAGNGHMMLKPLHAGADVADQLRNVQFNHPSPSPPPITTTTVNDKILVTLA
jgi:hypothetical protein